MTQTRKPEAWLAMRTVLTLGGERVARDASGAGERDGEVGLLLLAEVRGRQLNDVRAAKVHRPEQ